MAEQRTPIKSTLTFRPALSTPPKTVTFVDVDGDGVRPSSARGATTEQDHVIINGVPYRPNDAAAWLKKVGAQVRWGASPAELTDQIRKADHVKKATRRLIRFAKRYPNIRADRKQLPRVSTSRLIFDHLWAGHDIRLVGAYMGEVEPFLQRRARHAVGLLLNVSTPGIRDRAEKIRACHNTETTAEHNCADLALPAVPQDVPVRDGLRPDKRDYEVMKEWKALPHRRRGHLK